MNADQQSKVSDLTFLERFPTALAGTAVGLRHRVGLTKTAFTRGQEMAQMVKPEMQEQSALIIEAEDIQGKVRTGLYVKGVEEKTAELRAHVARMKEHKATLGV